MTLQTWLAFALAAAVHLDIDRSPGILAAPGLRREELLPPSGREIKRL